MESSGIAPNGDAHYRGTWRFRPTIALSDDGQIALWACRETARVWDVRRGRRAPWSYTRPRSGDDLTRGANVVREGLKRAARSIESGDSGAAISVLRLARRMRGYERNRDLLELWKLAARQARAGRLRDGWYLHHIDGDGARPPLALSADGLHALTRGGGDCVIVYEVRTGRVLQTLAGDPGWSVDSLTVSPDGRLAASTHMGLLRPVVRARVWELKTSRCLRTIEFKGYLQPRAVTADGRLVLTGGGAGRVVLQETESGRDLQRLKGHDHSVTAVAMSGDGRNAVSGGSDATVRAWDLASGRCLATMLGHGGAVDAVTLSADGRFAVSGGRDRTVRVWDVQTGRSLLTLTGHTRPVRSVALSADSRVVISQSDEGAPRVWELDWDLICPALADWDERARPHLQGFLTGVALLGPGTPLTKEDHECLLTTLARVGFGWLRPESVSAELERMWAERCGEM